MRIIPRLDIKNENVIKGINFEGLRVVGNPNEIAKQYYLDGSVKFEANFKLGIKNGTQKSYFQNGKIYSEGSYKNGEKDGLWKFFNIL